MFSGHALVFRGIWSGLFRVLGLVWTFDVGGLVRYGGECIRVGFYCCGCRFRVDVDGGL